MKVSADAQERLVLMARRSGKGCVGFRFDGAIGSCRGSKPMLTPVSEPVPGARAFQAGAVVLYASADYADVLETSTLDYDGALLFGQGLTISWPHREGGCPNCR